MGLLEIIESGRWKKSTSPSLSSEKEGLLRTDNTNKLSFFDFVEKYMLSHCAIFRRCGNSFVISNCIGFDGETIIKSLSTNDFWDGSIKKNDWTFFSRKDNSIITVLQFFSNSIKEKINFVGTYYTENAILLVAYEKLIFPSQEMNRMAVSFKQIDFNTNNKILDENIALKPKLSLTFCYGNAINNYILKNKQPNTNEKVLLLIKKALRLEFEYKLRRLSSADILFIKTEQYSIVCKSYFHSNMDKEALKSFLTLNLKSVLGNSAKLISYEE